MVIKYTRRHVVGQVMFGELSEIDIPSTALSTGVVKQISIMTFRTQAANRPISTTMNYANDVYDQMTYNMASATLTIESNSKMTSSSSYVYRHANFLRIV